MARLRRIRQADDRRYRLDRRQQATFGYGQADLARRIQQTAEIALMRNRKVPITRAETRTAVQPAARSFAPDGIVDRITIGLDHCRRHRLIYHCVAHPHRAGAGNQPVDSDAERRRHQINPLAAPQVARQIAAVNGHAGDLQRIFRRMRKREGYKYRFRLHRGLHIRRAARKAFRYRGIRFGIAVAEIPERLIPVKFDHPRISERLDWIPAATSGLFMEYTWMWLTPFAIRSMICSVA